MLSDRAETMRDDADGPTYGLDGGSPFRFERAAVAPEERLARHGIYGFPRGFLVRRPRQFVRRLSGLRMLTPAIQREFFGMAAR